MEVTAKSPDHLTVESRPWFVTGVTWLLGLAAILGAVFGDDMGFVERCFVLALGFGICAVAWRLMPFTSLDFDRADGTLTVTHARVTGATQSKYALTDIVRTLVQTDRTDSADLERLVLKTNEGITPVEFGFFSTPRQDIMQEINVWLEQAEP